MAAENERSGMIDQTSAGIVNIDAVRERLKGVYPPAPIMLIGSPPCAVMWDEVSVRSTHAETHQNLCPESKDSILHTSFNC